MCSDSSAQLSWRTSVAVHIWVSRSQAIVQRQEQRLGWGGYDDKAPPEKVTVIIRYMFGPGELSEDLGAVEELEKEVLAEATKLGPVEKVCTGVQWGLGREGKKVLAEATELGPVEKV